MYQLGSKGQKWLKTIHLLTACCWIGGALSLCALHLIRFLFFATDGEIFGIDQAAHAIDKTIVVYGGAVGCLVTGLIYSVFTGWGFFKHRWLLVKWIITVACITFGIIALGPWERNMLAISQDLGLRALSNDQYQLYRYLNFGFGFLQVLTLVFVIWISVFKPWKNGFKQTSPKPQV